MTVQHQKSDRKPRELGNQSAPKNAAKPNSLEKTNAASNETHDNNDVMDDLLERGGDDGDDDLLVTVSVQNVHRKQYNLTGSNVNLKLPALRVYPLCFKLKEFDIYFVRNCEGVTCFMIAEIIVIFSTLIFLIFVLPYCTTLQRLFIMPLFLFAMISATVAHFKAMTTDPGTIEIDSYNQVDIENYRNKFKLNVTKCNKCVAIKLPGTSHCSVCNRCISEMDHHCPWINNCVGQKNMKYFLLYNLYIFILSFISIITIIMNAMKGIFHNEEHIISLFMSFILAFQALLFGLFTITMLCSTLFSLYIGETYIEKLKKVRRTDALKGMKKIYSLYPSLNHLIPFSVNDIKFLILLFIDRH